MDITKDDLRYMHSYLISRMQVDEYIAEDITQKVALKLSTTKYKEVNRRKNFLSMCVRNAYINHYRADKRKWQIYKEYSEEQKTSYNAYDSMTLAPLRDAINTLEGNQKSFLLLFAEGYKYREIADQYGVPQGTVMSTLYRARQKIMKMIECESVQDYLLKYF